MQFNGPKNQTSSFLSPKSLTSVDLMSSPKRQFELAVLISAVTVAIGFVSQPGSIYLFWGSIFVFATLMTNMVITRRFGRDYGILFLLAIFIRLVVIFAIELYSPDSPQSSLHYVPGVIWEDETYYLSVARSLGENIKSLAQINLSDPYERVAGYYGLIILLANDSTVWGRMVNSFIGAITVLVIYNMLVTMTHQKTRKYVFFFSALSPVLVHFSVVYLKEVIMILSCSLIANSIVKLQHGRKFRSQIFKISTGIIIGLFVRNTNVFLLLPTLLFTLVVPRNLKTKHRHGLYYILLPLITIIIVTILAVPGEIGERINRSVGLHGFGTYLVAQDQVQEIDNSGSSSFPFLGFVLGMDGFLRTAGIASLLLISPVITSVWSLLPIVGNPNWYTFAIVCYAVSWWLCLPFLVRAAFDCLRQHDIFFLLITGSLTIWIILSAIARFGFGFDSFRYRDSYAPIIMLLAAKGLDTTLLHYAARKNDPWRIIIKFYFICIVSLIILRGAGIVQL
jgi:hypothetical protein